MYGADSLMVRLVNSISPYGAGVPGSMEKSIGPNSAYCARPTAAWATARRVRAHGKLGQTARRSLGGQDGEERGEGVAMVASRCIPCT